VKIVYCCFGGAHSSPVAAAIHLGQLAAHRLPTPEEIMEIPLFDRNDDKGTLHYIGTDELANEVYVLGRGGGAEIVEKALVSGYNLGGGAAKLKLVDTLRCVNYQMRIGGYLSRRLRLISIGRPMVLRGTIRAFPCLVAVVKQVKEGLGGSL
jgi:hypothetical protein